eukprot:1031540_1
MEPIQSLEELYRKLQNEVGFSDWKLWMEFHQFDFDCLVDDVNGVDGPHHQYDIKGIVPDTLYRKIEACIDGHSQHNITNNTIQPSQITQDYDEDMIQLIRALKTQISNKQALELILQKIIIDKFDFE